MDYYRLLTSSDTSWMAEDDAPFRFPTSFNNVPFIQCDLRHFKRNSSGRLAKPVVEHPTLCLPSSTGHKRLIWGQASTTSSSPRARFNWQLQLCVDYWHDAAVIRGCDHPAPLLRLRDDSLAALCR